MSVVAFPGPRPRSASRLLSLIVAVSMSVTACNSDDGTDDGTTSAAPSVATTEVPAPTTVVLAGPQEAVSAWIQAVAASDTAALEAIVEPAGFVLLVAIENSYSPAETAVLLRDGLPAELAAQYWSSFRQSFTEVAGVSLRAIEVGDHLEFTMGERSFAVVSVTSGEATSEVLTRLEGESWELDLIASYGPAFAGQLRRLLAGLPDGADGDRIRAAFRDDVVPGLLAAFRQNPGNHVLAQELERIDLLLSPS